MGWCNYLVNKIQDHIFRTTSFSQVATIYFAMLAPNRGMWAASTSYTSGDKVVPTTANGRMYRCTTSGTSGGSQPTWPTTPGATVSDGGAVWTEMTTDLRANTNIPEVSGGSYARVGVTRGDAQFKGTHGSTSGASSGTGGNIKNAGDIQFATPSATWGLCTHWMTFDASTSGNPLEFGAITASGTPTYKQVNNGDAAPKFPADAFSVTLDR